MQPMVLILGTADWNQAIATNQHYMAREIAAEFPILFSESLGLRRPELTRRDIDRMIRRLDPRSRSEFAERPVPAGMEVVRPVVVPVHSGVTKLLNRALLRRFYSSWISYPGPRILWTYSPVTYGFDEIADATIYHCVDLLAEFPQISTQLVNDGENALARTADLAIGSSGAVYEHLNNRGFSKVVHWPNVADVSLIRSEFKSGEGRRPGRAVFAGNFSEKKVDFELLRQLLHEGVELHLAGPIAEGGGKADALVKELVQQGAEYHGHLSLVDLAKLYWTASVGLIPYEINSYTRGVNPLKTFEYLAAGLHVVSTAIPAVNKVEGHVSVASNRQSFVRNVLARTSLPSAGEIAERHELADRNSWTLRGVQARNVLGEMNSAGGT
ncbi:glycosyltransferase [Arthrobacter sp. FW306-2-2C-D06B]|uniref:glycosyltransferase n=1 Tax=Arthrobacter sp. FW306-2-2C-D06B TaxID=2879618 RepID=UPI001F3EDD6B|nr:glycosyltransferase [Arthrobacter sp. FW306-2-2C-D06B]UKA57997.1 glycosyltransferase [Arthrobacter sp. FW306-2-2C-D06B]